MADALRFEVQRAPDGFRPGAFTGVRREMKTVLRGRARKRRRTIPAVPRARRRQCRKQPRCDRETVWRDQARSAPSRRRTAGWHRRSTTAKCRSLFLRAGGRVPDPRKSRRNPACATGRRQPKQSPPHAECSALSAAPSAGR